MKGEDRLFGKLKYPVVGTYDAYRKCESNSFYTFDAHEDILIKNYRISQMWINGYQQLVYVAFFGNTDIWKYVFIFSSDLTVEARKSRAIEILELFEDTD